MDDTFTATVAQIATDQSTPKPKRPPLTEEQKDALRNRLAVARAKRSEMARAGLLKGRPKIVKAAKQPAVVSRADPTFAPWSDDEWRACPLSVAIQRLGDLTADRERGAVLVSQRQNNEHVGNIYHCVVCKKLVPDGRWIWKNDRRDPITNLFTSDVLCSQNCHERFSNNVKFYMDRAKGVS